MITTKQQLLDVPIPVSTKTYTAIAHEQFFNLIERQLVQTNFEPVKLKLKSNRLGTRVIGVYQLRHVSNSFDIGPSIAFRNSYDKSMSAGLAVGANVFACTNGVFTGDVTIMRKHTGNADKEIKSYIINEISGMDNEFFRLQTFESDLKSENLSKSTVHDIVGELFFEQEVLKIEQLSIFKQEYLESEIDYNVSELNAWRIYNLLTYAIEQKSRPDNYFHQHKKVFNYFKTLFSNKITV